jgi:hypothetical protein
MKCCHTSILSDVNSLICVRQVLGEGRPLVRLINSVINMPKFLAILTGGINCDQFEAVG